MHIPLTSQERARVRDQLFYSSTASKSELFEVNRWWYWTPENRWMVYGQTGWAYPDTAGGYTTYYGNTAVAPAPAPAPADTGVNVVVPGATYYYGPAYGYYYPRRYYYGGPGVYVGGPRWGVRVGRWW